MYYLTTNYIIYGFLSILSYSNSKNIISNEIEDKMKFQTKAISENIEKSLLSHKK